MVRLDVAFPAVQILVKSFDPKDDHQSLLVQMHVVSLGCRQGTGCNGDWPLTSIIHLVGENCTNTVRRSITGQDDRLLWVKVGEQWGGGLELLRLVEGLLLRLFPAAVPGRL